MYLSILTETEKSVHKRQVQAVLGPSLQLGHGLLVVSPPSLPDGRSGTDVLGHQGQHLDGQGLGVANIDFGRDDLLGVRVVWPVVLRHGGVRGEQGLDSVGKVGQGQELTVGEGVQNGRLVNSVEGTRLDLADAVGRSTSCVSKRLTSCSSHRTRPMCTHASLAKTSSTTRLHDSNELSAPTMVTLTFFLPAGSSSTLLVIPLPRHGLGT